MIVPLSIGIMLTNLLKSHKLYFSKKREYFVQQIKVVFGVLLLEPTPATGREGRKNIVHFLFQTWNAQFLVLRSEKTLKHYLSHSI